MAADLAFEATELRLGLPGGGEGGDQARGGKRVFAETIDLKLKLEPAGEQAAPEEDRQAADVVAVKEEQEEVAATDAGGKMKRSPSQSSVITAAAMPDPAEKPRAPKYVSMSLLCSVLRACAAHLPRVNLLLSC
jgi:auxin-responsive protein IAA